MEEEEVVEEGGGGGLYRPEYDISIPAAYVRVMFETHNEREDEVQNIHESQRR